MKIVSECRNFARRPPKYRADTNTNARSHARIAHARTPSGESFPDSLESARARISALNRTYLPFQSVKRHWYLGCNESTSSRAKGRSYPGLRSLQVDLLKSNPSARKLGTLDIPGLFATRRQLDKSEAPGYTSCTPSVCVQSA